MYTTAEETARAIERELGDGWTLERGHGAWWVRRNGFPYKLINLYEGSGYVYTAQQVRWLASWVKKTDRLDDCDQIAITTHDGDSAEVEAEWGVSGASITAIFDGEIIETPFTVDISAREADIARKVAAWLFDLLPYEAELVEVGTP